MIESLLYLTASRPYISYDVGVCTRFQAKPKESHFPSVKRIIRCVSRTNEYGIWYSKDSSAQLVEYCEVDWVGNAEDKKSTSEGCFIIGNNLVSWFNKKQNIISLYSRG